MTVVLLPTPSPTGQSPLVTTVRPDVTQLYDRPIPGKLRGVAVSQGRTVSIGMTFFDDIGNAVDLTQYGITNTAPATTPLVQMRLREAMGFNSTQQLVNGMVTDAAAGQVSFDLTGGIAVTVPAVFIADCGVLDANGNVMVPDQIYVLCERTAFGTTTGGSPTVREVRLAMRDAPEYNLLLDSYQHDIAEICQAIVRAVGYWNSQPPPIEMYSDTSNFPAAWRDQWLNGICAELHSMAAAWYRRNENSVQGGGMQVDDLNKSAAHERAAAACWQVFAEFTKTSRISINLGHGYGAFGPGWSFGSQNW